MVTKIRSNHGYRVVMLLKSEYFCFVGRSKNQNSRGLGPKADGAGEVYRGSSLPIIHQNHQLLYFPRY